MIYTRTSKDITYTADGDLLISNAGSINLSTIDNLQLLCETIQRRLSHSSEEWDSVLTINSNLKYILGQNVSDITNSLIQSAIQESLLAYGLLDPNEVIISPVVMSGTKANITVTLNIENQEELINIFFIYDTRENSFQVKFLNERSV